MKARQKKKNDKKQEKCPECSSTDGIIGIFSHGKLKRTLFLYCSKCEYTYKSGETE